MNVDSILISEYASVDSNGRLTVVNVFNKLTGPGPKWGRPFFTISLVIHGHSKEAGTTHEGEIYLLDSERKQGMPEPIPFSFSVPEQKRATPGMPVRHITVMTIMGATLENPGPYAFEVHIDGIYHASASFFVEKVKA